MKDRPFEEVYSLLPSTGWLSEGEARLLWEEGQKTAGPILEVGSYYGRSTCLLGFLGRAVVAIEPFEGFDSSDMTGEAIQRSLIRNLEQRGLSNVVVVRKRIEEWNPPATLEVGLAYLDGHGPNDRENYRLTIYQIDKAIQCKAKAIAIHDVNDKGGGTEIKRAAVELLGREWDIRIERLAIWRMNESYQPQPSTADESTTHNHS